jgi:hypothetical protein
LVAQVEDQVERTVGQVILVYHPTIQYLCQVEPAFWGEVVAQVEVQEISHHSITEILVQDLAMVVQEEPTAQLLAAQAVQVLY